MLDHREIAQKMNLYMFSDLSPGCPIWLPAGLQLRKQLEESIKTITLGYSEVSTPILWKTDLYKTSGHLEHYRKNMFLASDNEKDFQYALKPMNCPGHFEIFRSKIWSYQDLPVRYAEFGPLHRNENSGSLGGLTRCRSFCQDDAHIFIREDQLLGEVRTLLELIDEVYRVFNMKISYKLSTRPENFSGSAQLWNKSEQLLKSFLEKQNVPFAVAEGDGAFYGPKIDCLVQDSLGREWQTATIQLDFQAATKFKLKYMNAEGKYESPIVIHRAIFGSFERFIGILLEHYQGKLPLWLSPTQFYIATVNTSEEVVDCAKDFFMYCKQRKIRCVLDVSNATLNKKVAKARSEFIPRVAVIGKDEVENGSITVRRFYEDQDVFVVGPALQQPEKTPDQITEVPNKLIHIKMPFDAILRRIKNN